MPSTNNHRKKAIKQVEEEPKVLRDANLTVHNKIPEAEEDSEGSDPNSTNQLQFLWMRNMRQGATGQQTIKRKTNKAGEFDNGMYFIDEKVYDE